MVCIIFCAIIMLFIQQITSLAKMESESAKHAIWLTRIVFAYKMIFSKRAIRPVVESFEKQKRFITDAGHEIKTPLAIISANTEVLEMVSEPNQWTVSIKNQITRLNGLLKELLSLAKMEEEKPALTMVVKIAI